ncbi:hypothetical protein SO802_030612 [Lithocarpus litseifolius]|uniref:Uncharacterized protein n=1 Tax=Lithocarpus litseifolius TaxID=425828 RepID=A0AAW2BK33_9ROSI
MTEEMAASGRRDGGKWEASGRRDGGGEWEKRWRQVGGKWEKRWRQVGELKVHVRVYHSYHTLIIHIIRKK